MDFWIFEFTELFLDFFGFSVKSKNVLEFSENGPILTDDFYRYFLFIFLFFLFFLLNLGLILKMVQNWSKCVRTGIFYLLQVPLKQCFLARAQVV